MEDLLAEKLPGWKVGLNIDRYERYGYLTEDENSQLYLDWRTGAEVDQKVLTDMLLNAERRTALQNTSETDENETEEETQDSNQEK